MIFKKRKERERQRQIQELVKKHWFDWNSEVKESRKEGEEKINQYIKDFRELFKAEYEQQEDYVPRIKSHGEFIEATAYQGAAIEKYGKYFLNSNTVHRVWNRSIAKIVIDSSDKTNDIFSSFEPKEDFLVFELVRDDTIDRFQRHIHNAIEREIGKVSAPEIKKAIEAVDDEGNGLPELQSPLHYSMSEDDWSVWWYRAGYKDSGLYIYVTIFTTSRQRLFFTCTPWTLAPFLRELSEHIPHSDGNGFFDL